MTPTQYHLLRQIVALMRPVKTEISLAMFKKLEEIAHETELDTASCWRASIAMLELALSPQLTSKLMVPITNADSMNTPPGVTNFVKGFVELGIGAQHFPVINRAFLWSLKQNLGSNFDSEMEEAWTQAFALVQASLPATTSEATAPVLPQDRSEPIKESAQDQLKELFRE